MLFTDVLAEECFNELGLSTGSKVCFYTLVFFLKARIGFCKVSAASTFHDEPVTLESIIISCFCQQHIFELLFVDPLVIPAHTHVNEHIHR